MRPERWLLPVATDLASGPVGGKGIGQFTVFSFTGPRCEQHESSF